ncbi:MAG: hypothetical protein M3Y64_03155 [Gemmatimonadota bacterium]|nr:hypothetical protein [Gemmatimonadota bacterium]
MSDSATLPNWVDGHPNDGTLHEGLDAQLTPFETGLVAEHVALCASCRARVAEAFGIINSSRRIVLALKEPVPEGGAVGTAPVVSHQAATAAAAPSTQPQAQKTVGAPPASPSGSTPVVDAIAAKVPAVTPSVPTVQTVPAAASTKPPRKGAKVQAAARPSAATSTTPGAAAQPVSALQKPLKPLPWNRMGEVAAVLVLVAVGGFVWRNISPDEVAASPARVAAPHAPAPHNTTQSEGKLADSAGPMIHSEYFDSLVLTRRTCTRQCTGYELHVTTNGTVHFVQLVAFGEPRVVGDALTAPKQKGIGKVLAQTLFESAAAAPMGHMLCNASDDDLRNNVRLVISKGNASQALSTNECKASSGELFTLAQQLDSLVGTAQLQKIVQTR